MGVTTMSGIDQQREARERTVVSRSRPVPATMMRPRPVRVPELAHMDVKRLRSYRRSLLQEELRTSYWRRLLQARRDLMRADAEPGDRIALIEALTEERSTSGRTAIMALHPDGGMPILPHLPDLWASSATVDDEYGRAELFARLASAESVLSSYREALHRRLDRATGDLVARYHDDPRQCFSALPDRPPRSTSVR
jgi:hypothetical protein